eukprot:4923351-Prymnesium_polylepis.1
MSLTTGGGPSGVGFDTYRIFSGLISRCTYCAAVRARDAGRFELARGRRCGVERGTLPSKDVWRARRCVAEGAPPRSEVARRFEHRWAHSQSMEVRDPAHDLREDFERLRRGHRALFQPRE